jgi:hypothetical protein
MRCLRHPKVKLLTTVLLAALAAASLSAGTGPSMSLRKITFSNQAVGTTSAPTAVTVSNSSRESVTISGFTLSSAQFQYSGPSLPTVLARGQSFTGNVKFAPTSATEYRATLSFQISNGSTISTALSGLGTNGQVIAPSVTVQPQSQTIIAGQTATFSVGASGTAPLTYQWKVNGSSITGATSANYTTSAEAASNSGAQFSVMVSNSAGSASSNAAMLSVNPAIGSLNPSVSSLSFGTVNVSSSESLSVVLTNAGNSSISITNVSIAGAGFSPSGVPSGLIIAGQSSATLTVAFAPATSGTVTGSVTVTSTASDPSVVINLSGAGATTSSSITLGWTESASGIAGYNVFRSAASDGPYTQLNSSLVTATQYTDSTALAGQTYYYVVTAVSSSDVQSGYSNQADAVVP